MDANLSDRRSFMASTAALTAGLVAAAPLERNMGKIPMRLFGRTNEKVCALGLGGHAATNPKKLSEKESVRLIQRAVDEGITFMDNCWDYHDGVAEERMGQALASDGRRDKVFLMTKVCSRNAKEARRQLDESLKRLKTDRLDLWQFHEIVYDNDPDWVFAADGAVHAGTEALKSGKVRYLGFTGHKDPTIHLAMLGKPFEWAAVQLPLNIMDAHFRSFQKNVLPELTRRGIAAIGMKSLGGNGSIVAKAGFTPAEAIRYVLSLPIATLISGIDSEKVLEQNLKIAREFEPMTDAERDALERRTRDLAGDGRFELFKSSKTFDGPYHRKQHGFEVAETP